MPDKPTTVARYLAALPPDRREALEAVRKVIVDNLDGGYEEGIQYGMIGYYVPHSVYPPGYHCDRTQPLPYIGLASQKGHMALYMFCVYSSEQEQHRFREDWARSGKKLDMGKSCVRFRKLDDVALDAIAGTVRRTPVDKFVAQYESTLAAAKKPAGKKTPSKKRKAR